MTGDEEVIARARMYAHAGGRALEAVEGFVSLIRVFDRVTEAMKVPITAQQSSAK
jgi:hypothetical protein